MIVNNLNAALANGERTGNLKLSGLNLESLDVLWKTNKPTINYSFERPELGWWETADYVNLDLSNNLLSKVDERILEWENVKTINLRNNSLKEFPDVIKLNALTKLTIAKNEIDQIVSGCLNLVDLDASYNRIFSFAVSLPNIKKLDLSHNKLTEVPQCIQHCRYLVSLNLSYNLLSDAQNSLDRLESLCDLDLSHNCIKTVFNNDTNLCNLARLAINHNSLTQIPFGHFRKLTDLSLSYNEISVDIQGNILNSAMDLQVLDISEISLRFYLHL